MKKPVEILVACGSGIASSSVAAEEVKKICGEAGIPVNVHKGTVQTIASASKNMDIIMTTSNFRGKIDKPVIKVFGLISGIGKYAVAKKIIDTCNEVLADKEEV